MLKDRMDLEKKLTNYIANTSNSNGEISTEQEWYMELLEKYNIPISMSSDIISQRKDISEYNTFILFALTDVISPKRVPIYFTPKEIELFSGSKYERSELEFPLKLHLIRVNGDQYIGRTTANFLMQLREKQLINYNAETQRALKIILKGGTKMLRPFINSSAVKQIEQCFSDRIFIPNMITLNINSDDERADYIYDDKEEILTIKDVTGFDIIDGYHRFLGMSRNYDRDNNWDYEMMLQITTFPLGKARQMIFQENQKTKMREVDLSSYDQYDAGNIVANRLNSDPECNLCGEININDGLVNAGIFAQAISRLYFDKKSGRKEALAVTKEIMLPINKFIESNTEFLDRPWKPYEILIVLYGIHEKYSPEQIRAALNNISAEQCKTLDYIKDLNNKVISIIKEVYSIG